MGARAVGVGLITVAILGAGVVVADRVAARQTEQVVVDAINENLDGVTGTPTVDTGGFPFLPQLFRNELDHVTAQVDSVTLEGVAVTDVDIDASNISTKEPYTVGSATMTGSIATAELQRLVSERTEADLTLTVDGDSLVAATEVLGLDLSAALLPRAESGEIRVDVETVRIGGLTVDVDDLPGALADRLRNLTIPIEGLPEGVTLTDVVVEPDGVRITAEGTDIVPELVTTAGGGSSPTG